MRGRAFTSGGGEVAKVASERWWWQAARTPRRGIVAAMFFGVAAVLDLVGYLSLKEGVWMLVSAIGLAVLAVMNLVSAVSQHRRCKGQPSIVRP